MIDDSRLETRLKTPVHAATAIQVLKQQQWHLDYARPGEGDPTAPSGPVNWHEMEDDEYEETWGALCDFLTWAIPRWNFTSEQLPHRCWWLHSDIVEELTAWWGLWQSAVRNPSAPTSNQMMFQEHTHQLKQRLEDTYRGRCRHEHQATPSSEVALPPSQPTGANVVG